MIDVKCVCGHRKTNHDLTNKEPGECVLCDCRRYVLVE